MAEARIRLISGREVDLFHLRPEDITIEDLAHGCAMLNRFGGHVPYPYSVAQHCVFVAALAEEAGESREIVRQCLGHDLHEGFGVVDLPSPVKAHCPDYRRAENTVWTAVAGRLGLPVELDSKVHEYDKLACQLERRILKCVDIGPLDPALRHFAERYLRPAAWYSAKRQLITELERLEIQ